MGNEGLSTALHGWDWGEVGSARREEGTEYIHEVATILA